MTEKVKNKHGQQRQFSKRGVLTALVLFVGLPMIFASIVPLKALALVDIVGLLSLITGFVYTVIFGILNITGFIKTNRSIDRFILGSILVAMALSICTGFVVVMVWLSWIIAPIALVMLLIYTLVLMLMKRPIYFLNLVALFGIASVFSSECSHGCVVFISFL